MFLTVWSKDHKVTKQYLKKQTDVLKDNNNDFDLPSWRKKCSGGVYNNDFALPS